MARKPRIVIDNGAYHVIQRGNDRRRVFREETDNYHFHYLIKKYLKLYSASLYHYCLMPNHPHLLLRVTKPKDLSRLMQGLNLSYTHYYKKKYKFIGSLWQGRYQSILIEKDEYLKECGRYIERNPVRAGMVNDPKDYKFSSFNFYAQGKESDIITENVIYKSLGSNSRERQIKYRDYVLEERAYDKIIDSALKL